MPRIFSVEYSIISISLRSKSNPGGELTELTSSRVEITRWMMA